MERAAQVVVSHDGAFACRLLVLMGSSIGRSQPSRKWPHASGTSYTHPQGVTQATPTFDRFQVRTDAGKVRDTPMRKTISTHSRALLTGGSDSNDPMETCNDCCNPRSDFGSECVPCEDFSRCRLCFGDEAESEMDLLSGGYYCIDCAAPPFLLSPHPTCAAIRIQRTG